MGNLNEPAGSFEGEDRTLEKFHGRYYSIGPIGGQRQWHYDQAWERIERAIVKLGLGRIRVPAQPGDIGPVINYHNAPLVEPRVPDIRGLDQGSPGGESQVAVFESKIGLGRVVVFNSPGGRVVAGPDPRARAAPPTEAERRRASPAFAKMEREAGPSADEPVPLRGVQAQVPFPPPACPGVGDRRDEPLRRGDEPHRGR